MLQARLGQLLLSCCLLQCIGAQTDYIYDNVEETIHTMDSECNGTRTDIIGSIEIFYSEIFNEFEFFCSLFVENATRFHLMLFQNPTELSENFYNVSGLINILLYDHDPKSGGLPVDELKDEGMSTVAIVPGNRVWLAININFDDVVPGITDFDDIRWWLAYVAVVDDILPRCNASDIGETENGVYIVRNNTFGSVAGLQCSEGFVLDNAWRLTTCSVIDSVLTWIPGTAVCSSVCEHPPTVANAIVNPQMDTVFALDNSSINENAGYPTESVSGVQTEQLEYTTTPASGSQTSNDMRGESSRDGHNSSPTTADHTGTIDTPKGSGTFRRNDTLARTNTSRTSERSAINATLRTNVTVYYTCNQPYIFSGHDRIHCGLDSRGVPRWFDLPPSCIIPNCSQTIILSDHSGAIVNPSYPGTTLKGGSQVCTWQIDAPDKAFILLSTMYVQLPDLPGVGVSVVDSAVPGPAPLLQLTNQSHPQNVTSQTSSLTVIYHGPALDVSGYRGFYLQYLIQVEDTSTPTIKGQTDLSSDLSEKSTSNTLQTSVSQTTELVTSHNHEQSTTPTSVQPTTPGTHELSVQPTTSGTHELSVQPTTSGTHELSVQPTSPGTHELSVQPTSPGKHEHTSETLVNPTTQQTTNQTTEDFRSSPWNSSTVTANQSAHNVTSPTAPVNPRNDTLTVTDGIDDSGDMWKIAIGVIAPLCALVLVLVCVFVWFRKKYPVRMMIGREVTKICNPQYAPPTDRPALVRENASTIFSRTQPDILSEEPAPEKHCVVFENLGFSADDSEEEKENKYVEIKKWLFGETNKAFESSSTSLSESCGESEVTGMDPLQLKSWCELEVAQIKAKESSARSLQQRHNNHPQLLENEKTDAKSREILFSPNNELNYEHFNLECIPPDDDQTVSASDENSGRSSPLSDNSESTDIVSEVTLKKRDDEESGFMKSSMILFQQPTFEEVWARVKARSKSLCSDRPLIEVKHGSCTVDPAKSARKMSLHDDVIISDRFRFVSLSTRSDQQAEYLSSSNIDEQTTPDSSPPLATQQNDCFLESSQQIETRGRQLVDSNTGGIMVNYNGGSVRVQKGNDETEVNDVVDESDYTDNMMNNASDESTDDYVTSRGLQISGGDPAAAEANVGTRKLHISNSSIAESSSSVNMPGFIQEENPDTNSSAGQFNAHTRRLSNEKQIQSGDSLDSTQLLSSKENRRRNENSTSGSDVGCAPVLVTMDASYSGTTTAKSHANLRTNLEHSASQIEMAAPKGRSDSQNVAVSYGIIEKNVDDFNDDITHDLNDCSDEESTGVKVTDSDISDILHSSSDEPEPEDSANEMASVFLEKMTSDNSETSMVLRQDSENNDIDV